MAEQSEAASVCILDPRKQLEKKIVDHLDKLSNEELLSVIAADKFKATYVYGGKQQTKALIQDVSDYLAQSLNVNHKALLLLSSISNTPTIPFILLWTLISLTTLSFPLLVLSAGILAAATAILIPIIYIANKNEQEKSRRQMLKELTANVLKQEATRLLLARSQSLDIQLPIAPLDQVADRKKYYIHLQRGLSSGFETASTFFCTYFAGAHAIAGAFEAVALSTLLTSGLSIGISIGLCVLLGCYFGLQSYRVSREDSYCAAWQKQSHAFIDEHAEQLEQIKTLSTSSHQPKPSTGPGFFSHASFRGEHASQISLNARRSNQLRRQKHERLEETPHLKLA